jgi:4-amino-4-deoxy-L-arabinose transferase-like glycosyltransferase
VYAVPALVWLAITLPSITQGDHGADSAWYTAIGVQAWRTGELWTLWGPPEQPYFNKPPIAFWIHGLVAWILGPGIWQARLPAVIAGLASVVLCVRLARGYLSPSAAATAGVFLALTYEFFRRSFEVSLDLWQLVFLLAACAAISPGSAGWPEQGRTGTRWRPLAAGACLGLALLCKPLVALLAIPILVVWTHAERTTTVPRSGASATDSRRTTHTLGRTAPVGLAMLAGAIAVSLPWHLSMLWLHGGLVGEFARQYFGAEGAARAAGEITAGALWSKPWWFYLGQLAATGWPWLALALLGGLDLALARLRPSARPLARLALVWVVVWLVVLSIFPDRRDRYAVVLHPAIALLGACWLDGKHAFVARAGRSARVVLAIAAVVGATLLIAVASGARLHRTVDPQWPALIERLRGVRGGREPNSGDAPRVWAAGLSPERGARIYLALGWWPTPTHNRWNQLVIDPSRDLRSGDWLLYHRRDGWRPGPGEREIWRERDLTITSLEPGAAWTPVPSLDPGE